MYIFMTMRNKHYLIVYCIFKLFKVEKFHSIHGSINNHETFPVT